MGSHQPIKRVAIIGAGASGLAAAKFLVAEEVFSQVDVFEQRPRVGGIWNLSSADKSKTIPIPQLDPEYGNKTLRERPQGEGDAVNNGVHLEETISLELESPLYDYLEANIPKPLMGFSDQQFRHDAPLFVSHEAVLEYLEEYSRQLKHVIRFNTQVEDIRPLSDSSSELGSRWKVCVRSLLSGEEETSIYDAVVVANGHYTIPYIPEVPGLADWAKVNPGAVIHSKAYRKPECFKDKKVLVVGNSASGLDISRQIGPFCRELLLSARSQSPLGKQPPASWRKDVPGLAEFLPSSSHLRGISFKNGQIEENVDAVIFATGYFYNYPFLSGLYPPLISHGFRTEWLYKHTFYIKNPTLAFPVLNLKVVPFPLAENQAAVIARVWSGRLNLPSQIEMKKWEEHAVQKEGNWKEFHLLEFPRDAEFMNELYDWAASASRVPGFENEGQGKLGTYWNERLVWMRSNLADIKGAFTGKWEDRFAVRTVEELGFDFEEWKAGQERAALPGNIRDGL